MMGATEFFRTCSHLSSLQIVIAYEVHKQVDYSQEKKFHLVNFREKGGCNSLGS